MDGIEQHPIIQRVAGFKRAGKPIGIRRATKLVIQTSEGPCLFCGTRGEDGFIGLHIPHSEVQTRVGAKRGQKRTVLYRLCPRCRDFPSRDTLVVKMLLSNTDTKEELTTTFPTDQ
ncbi:MAG: hypothetical protein H6839_03350 [Planctomycetes bacterium]|nr:hypothetical protein [Planctomycetota bacterium]